jgi:hypothetical protein
MSRSHRPRKDASDKFVGTPPERGIPLRGEARERVNPVSGTAAMIIAAAQSAITRANAQSALAVHAQGNNG